VTNELASTVTAFDLTSLRPLATIRVGDDPEGIEADPASGLLYVSNWDSNTVSIIDGQALTLIGTMPGGTSPRAFGTFIR